jgi:hypothetical protein
MCHYVDEHLYITDLVRYCDPSATVVMYCWITYYTTPEDLVNKHPSYIRLVLKLLKL